MKRLRLIILVAVLGFAGFLLARLPANYAYDLIHQERMAWSLAAIEGTLWDGRAGHGWLGDIHLDTVNWQIHPQDLLIGRIETHFQAEGPDLVASGRGGYRLFGMPYTTELSGTATVQRIADQLGLGLIKPTGRIEFEMDEIEFSRRHIESAVGTIHWYDSGITRPAEIAVGDLRVDIATGDDGITFKVTDADAVVGVDLDLLVCPDGAYEVSGTITPSPAATPELLASLQALGRRDNRGVIHIKQSGNLHR